MFKSVSSCKNSKQLRTNYYFLLPTKSSFEISTVSVSEKILDSLNNDDNNDDNDEDDDAVTFKPLQFFDQSTVPNIGGDLIKITSNLAWNSVKGVN